MRKEGQGDSRGSRISYWRKQQALSNKGFKREAKNQPQTHIHKATKVIPITKNLTIPW